MRSGVPGRELIADEIERQWRLSAEEARVEKEDRQQDEERKRRQIDRPLQPAGSRAGNRGEQEKERKYRR
jgi:hypothetical protein